MSKTAWECRVLVELPGCDWAGEPLPVHASCPNHAVPPRLLTLLSVPRSPAIKCTNQQQPLLHMLKPTVVSIEIRARTAASTISVSVLFEGFERSRRFLNVCRGRALQPGV